MSNTNKHERSHNGDCTTKQHATRARATSISACYTADEVLDGWRSHVPFRKVETGRGVKMPNPDPSAIAHARAPSDGGDGVDRGFAMWLHVEVFWGRHFELHPQRPFVLLGQECDGYFRFCDWYAENPLVRAYGKLPDDGGTREYYELVNRPLREAVDAYNATVPKRKQVTYAGALAAIKGDRLAATRPKGKWHTRVCDIEAWAGL